MIRLLHFFKGNETVSGVALAMLVSVFCLMFVPSALGQSTTSSITGCVTDSKGIVEEAVVTIVHTPTNTAYYALTNNKGFYRVSDIIAGGPYTVKVDRINHNTAIIKEIMAPVGATVIVDVVLNLSSVQLEEVTVYGDGINSSMNIKRSGAGVLISSKMMETLPTITRSLNDAMKFTPQAAMTGDGIAIGGSNYRGSSVSVDGATFNNTFGIGSNLPAGGTPISLDAIDQISINITPFNVRQSGFQGGAINIITKRGTNIWHGSVYDFFTNSDLQGKKLGNDILTTSKTMNNTVGFTLGGPIVKNKLFFFLNGEYTTDIQAGSNIQARVDENQEYGGSTGYNRPTVAQMDNILQFLSDKFGYNPGRYQNYSLSTPDYKILARVDWNINRNNILNIRFSHTHTSISNNASSSMSPLGGTNTTIYVGDQSYDFNRYTEGRLSQYAMMFESARYFQELNFTSLSAELNSRVLDGKGNNLARITWSYQNEPRSFVGGLFPTVDIMQPYTDEHGDTQYAMFTTFGPDPFTYGNLRRVNTFILSDEFTLQKGIHNILAGGQFEWDRIVNGFMQGGAGWYVYDSWQSFVDDVNDVDGAQASLFMITHANADDPTKQVFPTFDYRIASLYAQDEMEVSKFFKLTVGLRLEMPFIRFRYNNRNVEFDEIAAANPTSSFYGLSTDDVPPFDVHFSPRAGFNWDITHKRKLILRGGTGLFTGRIPNVWLVSAAGNSNCLQYQHIVNTPDGQMVDFTPDREDIIDNIYYGQAFSRTGLPAPTNATIISKDLHMPTSWKTSLALDYTMPGGIKATLEGVFSYNINDIYAMTLGYKEDGEVHLPGEPEGRTHYVSEGITNSLNKTMSGYYLKNVEGLHGKYFSLTAQLQKTFKFGLDLMAAYTYSYATTISDGAGDQVSSFANTPNKNGSNAPELGFSGFVAPHRVIAAIGYTIDEGKYTATKLGLFYEGYNMGIYSNFYQTRHSYLINNVSGLSSPQLMYIPTTEELAAMPFSSEENRAAFEEYICNDRYLSKHRGEYSKRNGGLAPWLNRINFKIAQEFYFNVTGHKQTLDVGVDINNIGNLLCNKWGAYKVLDSDVVLNYKNNQYTFTQPTWSVYNDLSSTWQILVHLRYAF